MVTTCFSGCSAIPSITIPPCLGCPSVHGPSIPAQTIVIQPDPEAGLAALKQQLQNSLAQVEAQQKAAAEALQPQTIEHVDLLQAKLQDALEALKARRAGTAGSAPDARATGVDGRKRQTRPVAPDDAVGRDRGGRGAGRAGA